MCISNMYISYFSFLFRHILIIHTHAAGNNSIIFSLFVEAHRFFFLFVIYILTFLKVNLEHVESILIEMCKIDNSLVLSHFSRTYIIVLFLHLLNIYPSSSLIIHIFVGDFGA